MACQRTDAPDKKSIKCGLFMGLSLNSKMYSKAIVFLAFLAMAVAGKSIFSIHIRYGKKCCIYL